MYDMLIAGNSEIFIYFAYFRVATATQTTFGQRMEKVFKGARVYFHIFLTANQISLFGQTSRNNIITSLEKHERHSAEHMISCNT